MATDLRLCGCVVERYTGKMVIPCKQHENDSFIRAPIRLPRERPRRSRRRYA